MKVWIDLANSPHVPFFAPIIGVLEARGHQVFLTAREFAQTVPLASARGWRFETVGGHGGASLAGKAWNLLSRAAGLRRAGAREAPDIAVSHGSYSLCLAARTLRLPCVTIMDYEHTPANHLSFRLATRVVVPERLDPAVLARYGAAPRKTVRYGGIKEQIYLSGFRPDPAFESSEAAGKIEGSKVLVVARPPADFALYHRFANPLFESVIRHLAADPRNQILVMPRTSRQQDAIAAWVLPGLTFVPGSTDGATLVARADLVVSAGGTMNREAAVLGTPAWTVFGGVLGAVDRWLAETGRLRIIRDAAEVPSLRTEKKTFAPPLDAFEVLDQVAAAIESLDPS